MEKGKIDKFLGRETFTVVEAMQKIDLNAKGILFVTDINGKLIGTVTDGDIRRAIINAGNLNMQVSDIMNYHPKIIIQGEYHKANDLMRQYDLRAVGVVDTNGRLIDIIFDLDRNRKTQSVENNSLQNVPVVIMAGGKGTRLYPYTKILPKPLIPIGDEPIIEHIMNRFGSYGVDQIYMTVNYKKNMIKSYMMEQKNNNIIFIEEDAPLGTAGSLRMLTGKIHQPFFVTNCDILIQANYGEIYEYHIKNHNKLTIVSALKNIIVPYGIIQSGENGEISALKEKPQLSYFINSGMYVLNPECIELIPEQTMFHMTDLVNKLICEKKKVGMYPVSENSFLDMGELEELQRMEQKLKENQ